MVLASGNDLLKGEDLDDILSIKGMRMKDDKLLYHGDQVHAISEVSEEAGDYGLCKG